MFDLKAEAIKALETFGGRYEDEKGQLFIGATVNDVISTMIERGCRNVSRFDEYDFREAGLKVVPAHYVGGVRRKRQARAVVVLRYI